MPGFDATAAVDVDAPPEKVWEMLTSRASEVWLGADVSSDWRPGSAITWAGEWQGTSFEDHGEVLEADAPARLVFTHASGSSGGEDAHRIEIQLTPASGGGTHVALTQDGNASEESAAHSSANMQTVLDAVKQGAEG